MSNKKLFFTRGTAYKVVDGEREEVRSIAAPSECDCELDCCLQAIRLKDHDGTGVKYLYILGGVLSVGTLEELKADSTIIA